ncbi:MAG TPA: hypothetical protein VNT20_16830 [Flavisolibacter sp.]|jgi:hypothetical protein|nr:hypothetical protein [Flavisolibacter sp.]
MILQRHHSGFRNMIVKAICLLALTLLGNSGYCQKIQYSKGTFPTYNFNQSLLVANVAGNHHILTFDTDKKPGIYIFNSQLQLMQKTKIDFQVSRNCDIKIVAFTNFYYLYLHALNSTSHLLWKIDGLGNVTSLSSTFQRLVDSTIRRYTATLQLSNDNGKFYIIAHNYYDTVKSVASTVLQLNDQLRLLTDQSFLIPLEKGKESLQQVAINNNSLFVLKVVRDNENGNSLDLLKIDLASGSLTTNSFNSSTSLYNYPRMRFCDKDSSILICSLLREPEIKNIGELALFIIRLNNDLQIKVPVNLIRNQFSNNTLANFVFVAGAAPLWLNTSISGYIRSNGVSVNQSWYSPGDIHLASPYRYFDYSFRGQPTGVRFTLLNKSLSVKKDSLVANNKNVMEIQPQPFAQFSAGGKAYVALIQNFTAKRRGLVMITADDKEEFFVRNLPVFDRYDYVLSQLQFVNDKYFVVPFFFKNEMGLMKVTMNEN